MAGMGIIIVEGDGFAIPSGSTSREKNVVLTQQKKGYNHYRLQPGIQFECFSLYKELYC